MLLLRGEWMCRSWDSLSTLFVKVLLNYVITISFGEYLVFSSNVSEHF